MARKALAFGLVGPADAPGPEETTPPEAGRGMMARGRFRRCWVSTQASYPGGVTHQPEAKEDTGW